jgi:type I restriction-modification system DNA methylase subunit/restriction endonuclease S subunit
MSSKIQELHSLFKSCLDILRNDAEHLIGDESLKELSYFLILKQVEKHIVNGSIDIYNLELYKEGVKKYGNDKFLVNLEYVKFSKLIEYVKIPEKENNIKNIFDEFLWKEVLSKHPKFKDVFEDGKKTFIKESNTIKKLVIALGNVDFNDYDFDILGEAYESIFVDAVFGAGGNKKSELGQFFTPPKVKKLLVSLVNPKLKDNGEIESVLDPASGTGGILNTIIKHFKQFDITDAELRKQLIKNIYGIEIKGKIYNLCLSNMLINTGEILPNVICADSIRKFHNIKVDTITANPPFSVTIPYDELISSLGSLDILNDYIPIKTGGKNSEVLFLQMMIHCLNINGRCSTVMLDGQKMYGTSSSYDKVREYLMKSCDLHEVILCPSGTFTSTASKTCILFFTKKKERKDVVELKVSGKKRTLTFVDSHSTKKVEFYNFDPDTEIKNFIKSINIDDIALKNYSLNYEDYDIEEEEIKKEEGIEWIILGEVCEINQGDSLTKIEMINGIYDVIGGGKIIGKHNQYNREGNEFTLTRVGDININYMDKPYYLTDNGFSLKSNQEDIMTKYLYYLLSNNKNYLTNLYKGPAQKVISKTSLKSIKIPIPSIEHQKEIIEFIDKLFTDKYNLQKIVKYYENNDIFTLLLGKKYHIFEKLVEWQEQSTILTKQLEFFKDRQARYLYLVKISENDIKTLGDVCDFKNGKGIKKDILVDGEYPVIGGGQKPMGFHNEYNTECNTILCSSSGAYSGFISKYNTKVWASDCFSIIPKNNLLNNTYLYYLLHTIQNKIYKLQSGAAQPHVYSKDLQNLKIPIPSLERQQEIVNYCKNNDKLIKKLEQEIETNKEHATLFIKSIVKIQANPSEETDIEDTLDYEQE